MSKPVVNPAAVAARNRRLTAAKPLSHVIEQHGEEAAFLWSQRDRAVRAPHYNLGLIERLDERVDAHVDGLRTAGDLGWETALKGLAPDNPGGVFSAAVLAMDTPASRLPGVIEVAAAEPSALRPLSAALGWIPWKRAEAVVRPWLESSTPAQRKLAVTAYALHRRDPGAALVKAASDSDAGVRSRALRAIGELGLLPHLPLAQRALGDANPEVAFAAAWTSALLSKDAGPLTQHPNPKGIPLAARRNGAGWARALDPRLAILAAGHAGDASAVAWLIEQMSAPKLARVAGEAFTMITGAVLDNEGLEGKAPEDFQAGPTDDPADADVAMDEDENLPWPDREEIEKWWKGRSGAFKPGVRYLSGRPADAANARGLLKSGFQRVRAAAALELAMAEPGKPLFEVRAPGFRQRAATGA